MHNRIQGNANPHSGGSFKTRGVVVVFIDFGLSLCHSCVCCFSTCLLQPATVRKLGVFFSSFSSNFCFSSCIFFFQMKALSEPDHVSVPDSTRSPSDPSAVTAVTATTVGTGSDGCDPCSLPPAADPLSAPAADDPPVPAEIEPSSLPPLDRRSRSSACPRALASACDPSATAPTPDVVLTNHAGSSKLDDAQQCSLPPRCESNFSSRTRSQPLMHSTAAEAAVRPPRGMSLELAASMPTDVARLTRRSTRYAHTAAVPLAPLRDPPTD